MSLTSPTEPTWSYRPGSWYAIFGDAVTVLLPAAQKEQVVGIWASVDGGAGFDEVLDALLGSGLSRLPAFGLVTADGPTARVLLRGDGIEASATAGGEETQFDGLGGGTWVERTLTDLATLRIVTPDAEPADEPAADVPDLPIRTGLVRVGRIDVPPAAPAPSAEPAVEPAVEPEAEPATDMMAAPVAEEMRTDQLVDPLSDPLPDVEAAEADAAPAEPEAAPAEPEAEPEPDDAEPAPEGGTPDGWVTPWDVPGAPPVAGADPYPTPDLDGDTQPPGDVPVPPEGVPGPAPEEAPETAFAPDIPPPPSPAGTGGEVPPPPLGIGSWEAAPPFAPPGTEHDGLTQTGEPAPEPAPSGLSGLSGAGTPPGQAVAQLLISDGQTVVVDRVILIGRAPEARRFTSTEQPQLITVPSRQHEISSTHVEVRPGAGADHGTAVVTDMGSTNGTVLIQPGLGPEDLKPGIAVQLVPGAIIDLGDSITIQVSRP